MHQLQLPIAIQKFFRQVNDGQNYACSICKPVQHKPHTVGWHGIENYCAQVFMKYDDVIKGSILKVLDEPERVFCNRPWGKYNKKAIVLSSPNNLNILLSHCPFIKIK